VQTAWEPITPCQNKVICITSKAQDVDHRVNINTFEKFEEDFEMFYVAE
jgi:hypothetical protein